MTFRADGVEKEFYLGTKKKSEKFLNVRVFIFRWNESCNNALLLWKNDIVHRKRFCDFSLCGIKGKSLFCGYFLCKNCGIANAHYEILARIFSENEKMLVSWNYNIYSNSLSFLITCMIFFPCSFNHFTSVKPLLSIIDSSHLNPFSLLLIIFSLLSVSYIEKMQKYMRKYNLGVNYSVVLILERCERTFLS